MTMDNSTATMLGTPVTMKVDFYIPLLCVLAVLIIAAILVLCDKWRTARRKTSGIHDEQQRQRVAETNRQRHHSNSSPLRTMNAGNALSTPVVSYRGVYRDSVSRQANADQDPELGTLMGFCENGVRIAISDDEEREAACLMCDGADVSADGITDVCADGITDVCADDGADVGADGVADVGADGVEDDDGADVGADGVEDDGADVGADSAVDVSADSVANDSAEADVSSESIAKLDDEVVVPKPYIRDTETLQKTPDPAPAAEIGEGTKLNYKTQYVPQDDGAALNTTRQAPHADTGAMDEALLCSADMTAGRSDTSRLQTSRELPPDMPSRDDQNPDVRTRKDEPSNSTRAKTTRTGAKTRQKKASLKRPVQDTQPAQGGTGPPTISLRWYPELAIWIRGAYFEPDSPDDRVQEANARGDPPLTPRFEVFGSGSLTEPPSDRLDIEIGTDSDRSRHSSDKSSTGQDL